MAISNTSTNYTDRKLDLHIMQGVQAPNHSSITPSFGLVSNYCAGVQKLIQRYTIMFLTELGSQENYPEFGSDFITKITSTSNNFNRSDLFSLFAFANLKVSDEIINYQIDNNVPLDEQLNVVELEEIVSTPNGGVSLKLKIIPRAEQPVEFLIPLP
jgi:hypothetical protein